MWRGAAGLSAGAPWSGRTPSAPSPDQQTGRTARHPVRRSSAPARSAWRSRSISSCAASRSCCSRPGTALGAGSRAICYAKRSLEILDRLGVGQRMLDKGVTWQLGKVFWRDRMVYQFDLLPEAGHRMPAFVNCQQYYLEQFLIERAQELANRSAFRPSSDRCRRRRPRARGSGSGRRSARTRSACDWLLACDGARSTVRHALGLGFEGRVFKDKFLITDVRMDADFPPERWFWFDPPFHPGQSALLHKPAGPGLADRPAARLGRRCRGGGPARARRPATSGHARQRPALRARMDQRLHLPLPAPGEVPPWPRDLPGRCRPRGLAVRRPRLQLRHPGRRQPRLEARCSFCKAWRPSGCSTSYDEERLVAADENIRHSTRSTEFITPKNEASRAYRDAVLALAEDHPFARRMINSGRLSTPTRLDFSSLNTPDRDRFARGLGPGSPAADAPLEQAGAPCWLLNQLVPGLTLLLFLDRPEALSPTLASRLGGARPGAAADRDPGDPDRRRAGTVDAAAACLCSPTRRASPRPATPPCRSPAT